MVVKKCTYIPRKGKPFWELITSLAYFAVNRNTNLFVHEKLTKILPRILKCTLRKENFVRKKMKNLKEEFLQLFVETSANNLSPLPKKNK